MIGKTNLAEVLDECEVGSNTYRALQRTRSGILFWQSVYVFLTLLIGPVPGQLGHFDVSRVTMKLGVSYGGLRNILTTNWLRSGTPK